MIILSLLFLVIIIKNGHEFKMVYRNHLIKYDCELEKYKKIVKVQNKIINKKKRQLDNKKVAKC